MCGDGCNVVAGHRGKSGALELTGCGASEGLTAHMCIKIVDWYLKQPSLVYFLSLEYLYHQLGTVCITLGDSHFRVGHLSLKRSQPNTARRQALGDGGSAACVPPVRDHDRWIPLRGTRSDVRKGRPRSDPRSSGLPRESKGREVAPDWTRTAFGLCRPACPSRPSPGRRRAGTRGDGDGTAARRRSTGWRARA